MPPKCESRVLTCWLDDPRGGLVVFGQALFEVRAKLLRITRQHEAARRADGRVRVNKSEWSEFGRESQEGARFHKP